MEEIISKTKVSKALHQCLNKNGFLHSSKYLLYTCKFLILVISVKDHQVTLESGVIVRLRNSKVLVFAKLISSFYSKFALSCRFQRTFVTGHGHIILHVNKKIGKLLLTIFLSLMIHSACGLVLAKSWNNLYIFFTLKYLNEKTLFVVFCS